MSEVDMDFCTCIPGDTNKNHGTTGAMEAHSLPPEPGGLLTVCHAALSSVVTVPIADGTQPAFPCLPTQPTLIS